MVRITIRSVMVVSFAAFVLAGCASKQEAEKPMDEPTPVVVAPVYETPEPVVEEIRQAVVSRGKLSVPSAESMDGMEELQGVFYFDFDQAIVKRGSHVELSKHAMAMREDPTLRLRLEGHADERGTREYNLGLGERRANAVRAYLVAEGASRSQIEVISYGEEKPADGGHSEAAWAMNRRVEAVYR